MRARCRLPLALSTAGAVIVLVMALACAAPGAAASQRALDQWNRAVSGLQGADRVTVSVDDGATGFVLRDVRGVGQSATEYNGKRVYREGVLLWTNRPRPGEQKWSTIGYWSRIASEKSCWTSASSVIPYMVALDPFASIMTNQEMIVHNWLGIRSQDVRLGRGSRRTKTLTVRSGSLRVWRQSGLPLTFRSSGRVVRFSYSAATPGRPANVC